MRRPRPQPPGVMNSPRRRDEHLLTQEREQRTREPQRICVGCKERDSRGALARLVIEEPRSDSGSPRIVADVMRRLPGRGVSIHPRRGCVEAAARKGGLSRGFRTQMKVEPAELIELLSAQYEARMRGLLLAARRSGALAVGTDAVREAMGRVEGALLIVAADAAGRREEIEQAATRLAKACIVFATKDELGRLLGRATVGVCLVLESGIAAELARTATLLTQLSEDG